MGCRAEAPIPLARPGGILGSRIRERGGAVGGHSWSATPFRSAAGSDTSGLCRSSIGWEIDSHSVNHPDLTMLAPSLLRYQLVDSRRFLRHTLRIPVNSFCYPSSRYDARVIAAVEAAGYTNALTEHPGLATRANPDLLNRFEIEGGVSQLAADLAAG